MDFATIFNPCRGWKVKIQAINGVIIKRSRNIRVNTIEAFWASKAKVCFTGMSLHKTQKH